MPSPRTSAELLNRLALAFPKHFAKLGLAEQKALRALYEEHLADIPGEVLEAVVDELIRTEDWFPPVSRIRALAAERTLALPGEAEALAQIEARMRWGRRAPEERGPAPPVHPLVREALDHLGGFHGYRVAEEPSIIIGQFGRLYRELRATALRETQVGTPALTAGEPQRAISASVRPVGPVS